MTTPTEPREGGIASTWRRIRRRRRGRVAIAIFSVNFVLSVLLWLFVELSLATCRSNHDCSATLGLGVLLFLWGLGELFLYLPVQIALIAMAADPKGPD